MPGLKPVSSYFGGARSESFSALMHLKLSLTVEVVLVRPKGRSLCEASYLDTAIIQALDFL